MGTILKAACPCGFVKEDIFYGGGRMNFTTHCEVPAINKKTGKFLTENFFSKDNLPEEIVFYNDPRMYKGKLVQYELQWGKVHLNPLNNLCPSCSDFTMEFQKVGFFD